MLEQALAKIQEELIGSPNNPYVQAVGNLLILHLNSNPGDAEKILTPGKTVAKSLDVMRRAAEKKKVGNYAVLTDAEGFAVVLDYFRQAESVKPEKPPEKSANSSKKTSNRKSQDLDPVEPNPAEAESEDDGIDFDALLL